MYQWCGVERLSCHSIARRLTDLGAARKKGSAEWRKGAVGRLLRYPVYKGVWLYHSDGEQVRFHARP